MLQLDWGSRTHVLIHHQVFLCVLYQTGGMTILEMLRNITLSMNDLPFTNLAAMLDSLGAAAAVYGPIFFDGNTLVDCTNVRAQFAVGWQPFFTNPTCELALFKIKGRKFHIAGIDPLHMKTLQYFIFCGFISIKFPIIMCELWIWDKLRA